MLVRHASRAAGLFPGSWAGEGVEFGEYGGGFSRADPLEYHVCLPQQGFGSRGVAGGRSAAAQAGQRVGLVPGTADRAGQFQGLLVTRLSLGGFTAEPVQRPCLIKHLSLTTPVADVAEDGQGLLQVPGRPG